MSSSKTRFVEISANQQARQHMSSMDATSSSTDIPKFKSSSCLVVIDGNVFEGNIEAETNLTKGRAFIYLSRNGVMSKFKEFKLGGVGNLVATVKDNNLCLAENDELVWIMFDSHNNTVDWAKFLCSSIFANAPIIRSNLEQIDMTDSAHRQPKPPNQFMSSKTKASPRKIPSMKSSAGEKHSSPRRRPYDDEELDNSMENMAFNDIPGPPISHSPIVTSRKYAKQTNFQYQSKSPMRQLTKVHSRKEYASNRDSGYLAGIEDDDISLDPNQRARLLQLRIRDAMTLHEISSNLKLKKLAEEEKAQKLQDEKRFRTQLLAMRHEERMQNYMEQQALKEQQELDLWIITERRRQIGEASRRERSQRQNQERRQLQESNKLKKIQDRLSSQLQQESDQFNRLLDAERKQAQMRIEAERRRRDREHAKWKEKKVFDPHGSPQSPLKVDIRQENEYAQDPEELKKRFMETKHAQMELKLMRREERLMRRIMRGESVNRAIDEGRLEGGAWVPDTTNNSQQLQKQQHSPGSTKFDILQYEGHTSPGHQTLNIGLKSSPGHSSSNAGSPAQARTSPGQGMPKSGQVKLSPGQHNMSPGHSSSIHGHDSPDTANNNINMQFSLNSNSNNIGASPQGIQNTLNASKKSYPSHIDNPGPVDYRTVQQQLLYKRQIADSKPIERTLTIAQSMKNYYDQKRMLKAVTLIQSCVRRWKAKRKVRGIIQAQISLMERDATAILITFLIRWIARFKARKLLAEKLYEQILRMALIRRERAIAKVANKQTNSPTSEPRKSNSMSLLFTSMFAGSKSRTNSFASDTSGDESTRKSMHKASSRSRLGSDSSSTKTLKTSMEGSDKISPGKTLEERQSTVSNLNNESNSTMSANDSNALKDVSTKEHRKTLTTIEPIDIGSGRIRTESSSITKINENEEEMFTQVGDGSAEPAEGDEHTTDDLGVVRRRRRSSRRKDGKRHRRRRSRSRGSSADTEEGDEDTDEDSVNPTEIIEKFMASSQKIPSINRLRSQRELLASPPPVEIKAPMLRDFSRRRAISSKQLDTQDN